MCSQQRSGSTGPSIVQTTGMPMDALSSQAVPFRSLPCSITQVNVLHRFLPFD